MAGPLPLRARSKPPAQGEIDDPELRSGRHREAGHFQQRGQAGVTAGQPEIDGRRTGREPQRAR
jgi:hypothetical protein